jgi:hypothetical protein
VEKKIHETKLKISSKRKERISSSMDGEIRECETDSSSSSSSEEDEDANVFAPRPFQRLEERSGKEKKKKKKKINAAKRFFSSKKKKKNAAPSSSSSSSEDEDCEVDESMLEKFEFLDAEERAIMSTNRLEHRIEPQDANVDAAFSILHAQFFTSTSVDVEKFVKPKLHDDTDATYVKFKVAAERLRAKVHRNHSHRRIGAHEIRQAQAKENRPGRKMFTNLNGKFLRLDENKSAPKTANLRSDVANADTAVNIGLKLAECLRRDSVFQNSDVTTYDSENNIVMVEKDLHFDGEDESVKRFLLATRLIVAQIAEILRPRGPGFNEKSPSAAIDPADDDASMRKKKSEIEEVTFTHADPFDAYDSSDEEKAVRSDTGALPLPPPLGSHVVRCVETPESLDFVRSLPEGTPLSVYFQENNAYNFKEIRTADHFLDGSRQKIRSSTKIQAIPKAEMYGASLLIHMELPGPMEREECAPKDVCREGCYVELNGASGHPDYLSRWRRRENCPQSERSVDTEVYTFTLPTLKAHEFFLREPIGELCGDVKIECEKTGLEAILKFHEYDAEFSPAMRNLVTGVVTKKETNEVKRMLFGTWDSVIFWEDPIKSKSDELQVVFDEAETLSKGVLYDDLKHAVTQRGFVRPLSQSITNNVRSLATAIKCPQTMSREKLWMAIQSAIRYSKKLGHLGNLCSRMLLGSETLECQDEQRGTGTLDLDMGWEMTTLVATKLPPDAEPPLPAIWQMQPSPPPKKGHVEKYGCGLFHAQNDKGEEEKKEEAK